MPGSGELVKLKMVAYKDEEFSQKAGNEFEVLINPSSYKHSYSISYKDNESMGKLRVHLNLRSLEERVLVSKLCWMEPELYQGVIKRKVFISN